MDKDQSTELQAQVATALDKHTSLRIQGGNTKHWYGRLPDTGSGVVLSLAEHRGIINYEPTELVITARSGTPLREIEAALQAENQCLPFEPPQFGAQATLGGTIACNFSGPARPYAGAARDLLLGCRIINGQGEILSFGGEVMKNVAGYDVSRLMAGALGTLGVLLEVSLKVLPRPEQELTVVLEMGAQQALEQMTTLASRPLPLSAACHVAGQLYLRLFGTPGAVKQARTQLGGEVLADDATFWEQLREQTAGFFRQTDIWRLSVAADTPLMESELDGQWIYDWGGAQRWLAGTQDAAAIRTIAEQAGGHATLFRSHYDEATRLRQTGQVFHPPAKALMHYQQRLKVAFDPQGIFNPQRLYAEF